MRVLNDFHCPACDTTEERFVEASMGLVACTACGKEAKKVRTVPNFSLPGNDKAGFPTAYDAWEKKRNQKMAEERKQDNS